MDRTTPLLPISWIAIFIILGLLLVLFSRRSATRERWPCAYPELLVVYSLALIHLLFFWQPYRSAAKVPAGGGDLVSFFYPIHAFAAGEIQAGRFPFWSPHQFSGMPHLANFQTGALYPLNLIAYVSADPFNYATLERLAIFHFFIASYGAYWLARSLGLGRSVSSVAGVVFAYSGFMTAHLGHYPMLVTAAWSPFVFAALIATVRRGSWPIAVGGTTALALAILGGHQPMLLLVLSSAGLVALFELWRASGYAAPSEWRERYLQPTIRRASMRCLYIVVIAFGLTIPAWGPALEMTRYTSRSELSYEQASEFSVEPLALIHMVTPTVFGSNPTDYWGPFTSTEIWGYAGTATLVLAAIGIAAGRRRSRLCWSALGLLGLLYAVGPFSPVHGWLYAFVPGFDRLRGAGRGYYLVDLSLAILAAYGLRELSRYRARPTLALSAVLRYATWGLLAAFGALILFVIPLFTSRVLGVNDPSNRPMIALDNLIMLALWIALTLALVLLVRRNSIGGFLAVALLGGLVVLDLFSVTARFNPMSDPLLTGFDHPELIQFLDEQQASDGPFRIDIRAEAVQPDFARLYGYDAVEGLVDPLALENYERWVSRAESQETLWQEANTRYVLTDLAAESPASGSALVLSTDRLLVWELDGQRTRAWFAADPTRAVTVSADVPGQVTIRTDADSPGGDLVLSQVDYPGWNAEIDGRQLEIDRYQGTLQRMNVPAGEHRIGLEFTPRYWRLWLAISAASGIVLIATLAATTIQPFHRRALQDPDDRR